MTTFTLRREAPGPTATPGGLYLNGARQCATLEDLPQSVKIKGKTRIPPGRYPLRLEPHSGFNERYQRTWGPTWHPGIIAVDNVPGFSLIRMHMGNSHHDTDGCILIGRRVGLLRRDGEEIDWLFESKAAYIRVYPAIRDLIRKGPTWLEVVDA